MFGWRSCCCIRHSLWKFFSSFGLYDCCRGKSIDFIIQTNLRWVIRLLRLFTYFADNFHSHDIVRTLIAHFKHLAERTTANYRYLLVILHFTSIRISSTRITQKCITKQSQHITNVNQLLFINKAQQIDFDRCETMSEKKKKKKCMQCVRRKRRRNEKTLRSSPREQIRDGVVRSDANIRVFVIISYQRNIDNPNYVVFCDPVLLWITIFF